MREHVMPSSTGTKGPEAAMLRADEPDGSTLTDVELVDLCRAGDGGSWAILVRRYTPMVMSVALRAGVSYEDAKDVTQTTFIAFLESSDRIRQDERIASWLVTVAQRVAWRARRRLRAELITGEVPDRYEDPNLVFERVATVQTALTQLGGPCQELLTALYLDPTSPSYVEIAARLGRAVGTIGPTRGRCLAKLRSIIGEDVW